MKKRYDFKLEAEKVVKQIRKTTAFEPEIAIMLGSGWGGIVDMLENPIVIPYASLKGLPKCTVVGHGGNFVMGTVAGKNVIFMQGRFHLYEGHPAPFLGVPITTMFMLGAKKIIVTNAAGATNEKLSVGDVVILKDHIDLTCQSPLTGMLPTEKLPVFIDMSQAYSKRGIKLALDAAKTTETTVKQGVYCQKPGPCYETPSEVMMVKLLGGDVVGMSTVMDVVSARYLGMEVIGLSLVTNMGTGLSKNKLSHEEVNAIANANKGKLKMFLSEIVKNY